MLLLEYKLPGGEWTAHGTWERHVAERQASDLKFYVPDIETRLTPVEE